jgi:outer membrane receptor for Fe3+-dicitrate
VQPLPTRSELWKHSYRNVGPIAHRSELRLRGTQFGDQGPVKPVASGNGAVRWKRSTVQYQLDSKEQGSRSYHDGLLEHPAMAVQEFGIPSVTGVKS